MGVRRVLPAVLVLAALGGVTAEEPRRRAFELRIEGRVEGPEGAIVDLWLPLPHEDGVQEVGSATTSARCGGRAAVASVGTAGPNRFLHVRGPAPVELAYSARVVRRERVVRGLDVGGSLPLAESELARHRAELDPESLNPLDDRVEALARSIAPNERRVVAVARAIYDHVLGTMRYEKPPGQAWGRGSVAWACDMRYGNCTDFHSLFIALCRARGIPARFSIGLSLPRALAGEARLEGYHCWAEFLAPGLGWVPVDASEAWKDRTRRDYFFGALDEHRVELTTGRDLVLAPPQKGPPLNFVVEPYAERDGKSVVATRRALVREIP